MSKINDAFKKAVDTCMSNSETWLNEANKLYEQNSYGHACALWVHGLEALIQAYFCWLIQIDAIKPDNPDFLKVFKAHKTKFQSFYGFILTRIMYIHLQKSDSKKETAKRMEEELKKETKKLLHESSKFSRKMIEFRNKGIYVNYDIKKGEFTSPNSITKEEADNFSYLIHLVYEQINWYIRMAFEDVIKIVRDTMKELYEHGENACARTTL